jgi:hypothetical protein
MKTLLQTITDALEAAGVRVTAIETYPPDNGAVSVSLTVRADHGAENRDPDLENRLAAPGAGLDGCHDCPGGPQCDDCPISPENSTPVKLYSPEEAATALKKGRILQNAKGDKFSWIKSQFWGMGFYREDKEGNFSVAHDLSGLYEETAHA